MVLRPIIIDGGIYPGGFCLNQYININYLYIYIWFKYIRIAKTAKPPEA